MPENSAFHIPHSPIAALGTVCLLIAFLIAGYAAATGIVGNARKKRRMVTSSVYALYAFFGVMALVSALIVYAFLTHDFAIKYVAHYSDVSMPFWYKITAYWGGLDGSIMFWVFVLSAFAAVAVKVNSKRHRDMIGYVVATIMIVELFFLAIIIYTKNPFATFLTAPPADGKGLNPLLQNYWMVIHPPSLYTGFVAATIPFAFGIAALASGRLDDQWLSSVRVWVLICWFFLSFGLILGGRWAYEELGWGGYWAWDPVENAGLIPWFTATAFLHSVMLQEQRGMMKVWNLVLVITTFFFTIFGTFMTRSGVVQSVHAFGQDNELALLFILFLSAILIFSFGLLLYRLPKLGSSNSFESFISREYAFLLNNWILLACAFFVLFATMFPTLSQAVNGQRITVGKPFFNKWMVPLGLVLLFLAGAAPLLAWRRTTRKRLISQFLLPLAACSLTVGLLALFVPRTRTLTSIFSDNLNLPVTLVNFGLVAFTITSVAQEFWRGMRVRMRQTGSSPLTALIGLVVSKRRKYGGYVIHVGIAVMFIGFAGRAYDGSKDATLSHPGASFSYRDYGFKYEGLTTTENDHKLAVAAHVVVSHHGHKIGDLYPGKSQFNKFKDQPVTDVAINSSIADDIYMVLTGFSQKTGVANFRVYINPLINWVWGGFVFLFLGTLICLLPAGALESLRTRRGGGGGGGGPGSAALILIAAGALVAGGAKVAHAQRLAPAAAPTGMAAASGTAPGGTAAAAPRASRAAANGGNPAAPMRSQTRATAPRSKERAAPSAAQPAAANGSAPSAAQPAVANGSAPSTGPGSSYRPNAPLFLDPYREKIAAKIKAKHPNLSEHSPAFRAKVAAETAPIIGVATRLMKDIGCTCGCLKTLYACTCGKAANMRREVLLQLSHFDLTKSSVRDVAYHAVLKSMVAEYGQDVLKMPIDHGFNRLAWMVPYAAIGGALFLLWGVGRRWVRRGRDFGVVHTPGVTESSDDPYAEILDDELRDID